MDWHTDHYFRSDYIKKHKIIVSCMATFLFGKYEIRHLRPQHSKTQKSHKNWKSRLFGFITVIWSHSISLSDKKSMGFYYAYKLERYTQTWNIVLYENNHKYSKACLKQDYVLWSFQYVRLIRCEGLQYWVFLRFRDSDMWDVWYLSVLYWWKVQSWEPTLNLAMSIIGLEIEKTFQIARSPKYQQAPFHYLINIVVKFQEKNIWLQKPKDYRRTGTLIAAWEICSLH